jgi:hypothetical protein
LNDGVLSAAEKATLTQAAGERGEIVAAGPNTNLAVADQDAIWANAQTRAQATGKTPQQELYDYATSQGYSPAQIDVAMSKYLRPGDTQAWLDSQITTSSATPTNNNALSRYYRETLGRDPDPSGFQNWIDQGFLDDGVLSAAEKATLDAAARASGELRAKGGIIGLAAGGMARGGFVVPADVVSALGNGSTDAGLRKLMAKIGAVQPIKGKGDGLSDSIPTNIDGRQPARVADGEAYVDPRTVAKIGGGDAKKGAKKLYAMMEKIRMQAHGKKTQQRKVNDKAVA